jgi:CxxC motif-containing protein (DUF1111 family)
MIPLLGGALLAACSAGGDADESNGAQVKVPTAPTAAVAMAAATPDSDDKASNASAGGGGSATLPAPNSNARDPGPRTGNNAAGTPFASLTAPQLAAFAAGKADFEEVENVEEGLGPRMNLDSCGGCHSQPAIGGSSPAVNPQVAFARRLGASNVLPPFIKIDGPVREARFVRAPDGSPDGGVHALFTIAGRSDAPDCSLKQPDFARALAARNVVFRIPTPLFGAGLIEAIPDSEILRNKSAAAQNKLALGIGGRPNLLLHTSAISGSANKNGNDGTIGRFGWKAQNKSLLIFAGEAYNVEMGITSAAFPTERDETEGCNEAPMPNTDSTLDGTTPAAVLSSIERFALFMRFLAPPAPSATAPGGADSIARGREQFAQVGCALCHTPSLTTYNASVVALRKQSANLYSDLLLHDMGAGLADGIQQGQASGREWRTAPLWGLGQRLFFLHDGRTSDLRQAIAAHASEGSEANAVVRRFFNLGDMQQQDVLNFLRAL